MASVTGVGSGHAVQVVRVSQGPGNRYELNTDALTSLLEQPEVRERPVAVISVAGSFRGGKSFLLGFFLRYLNASRADQTNGNWLGREDEPLQGFNWRAGCERETTGIHLWSKPAIIKLDDGQEIAVLLMDTQGTFDTESTLQDSSTIFALSTLISSVQIYNIFRNIQEDDLQHLHLFTDYGRLAAGDSNDGGKAFQVLQFLVRDWSNVHEFPYGTVGGTSLLQRRLQMSTNQKQELREVREHICSCFDSIRCFLMAHPGLSAGSNLFGGRLNELTTQFRQGLLEFIPSLFDPKNLTPKMVGGNRIKTRDLLLYFQNYVDVFNSEELPPAVSILKGTATACLVAAVRDARDAYDALMRDAPSETHSITPNAVRKRHCNALHVGQQLFIGKRKLGSKEDTEEYYEQLTKDLEARLALYILQNDVKIRDDLASAKTLYEDIVQQVCEVKQRLCVHPMDLEQLHTDALKTALALFDSTRQLAEGEDDGERDGLLKELAEKYDHLTAVNEQNNELAVVESRELYVTVMKREMPVQSGVSTVMLETQHERATATAREKFASRRSRPTQHKEDKYVNQLLLEIDEQYVDFERLNLNNNRMAMQAAEHAYNNYVSSEWGPQVCCYHPLALAELHKAAMQVALKDFRMTRTQGDNDDYKDKLVKVLENRYEQLQQINVFNNKQAVAAGFREYTRRMDRQSAPSFTSIAIAPFVMKMVLTLPQQHSRGRSEALAEFAKRRRGHSYEDDEYRESLKKKIDSAYDVYKNPLQAVIREFGLPMLKDISMD